MNIAEKRYWALVALLASARPPQKLPDATLLTEPRKVAQPYALKVHRGADADTSAVRVVVSSTNLTV